MRARFKFGDIIENGYAADSNPTKRGVYLWTFTREGRLNPGKHVKLLHENGKRGELRISDDDKMTVVGTIFDEAIFAERQRTDDLIEEVKRVLEQDILYIEVQHSLLPKGLARNAVWSHIKQARALLSRLEER